MPRRKVLKTFKGSQDGRITETFEKGSEVDLSDYLMSNVDPDCVEEINSSSDDESEIPIGKMNKAQLQEALTALGVDFESGDNKAVLIEKLTAAQEG